MTYININDIKGTTSDLARSKLVNSNNSSGHSGNVYGFTTLGLREDLVESIDLASINANYVGYATACFDGRYLYLTPYANGSGMQGYFLRYDTTAAFTTGNVDVMDLTTISASFKGFTATTFDGRYIYLVQGHDGTSYAGKFLRYDTQASFTAAGSYAYIDLFLVDPYLVGIYSLCFDGRYVYGITNIKDWATSTYTGHLFRYDTSQSFATGNVDVINIANENANAKGYTSICFDGQNIYCCPYYNGSSAHGLLIKYDTSLSFLSSNVEIKNLESINANLKGFYGLSITEDHMYIIPYNDGSPHGKLVRCNLNKSFSDDNSYEYIDLTSVDSGLKGYKGSIYDGRYLYLIPFNNGSRHGKIARIDTYNFNTSNVEFLDLANVNANFEGFWGASFDGKYMYLVPNNNGSYHGNLVRIKVSIIDKILGY